VRISWGTGITISIILFTIISLWIIYFAFNEDVNLVRDDYYEAEVNFDEKLETIKRTDKLDEKLKITTYADRIELKFPDNFDYLNIEGIIKLYRPSNRDKDIQVPIKLDSNSTQIINTDKLLSGLWKIQVDWAVYSDKYFNEKILMVK
jgi:nitrogen fixation protein FixH